MFLLWFIKLNASTTPKVISRRWSSLTQMMTSEWTPPPGHNTLLFDKCQGFLYSGTLHTRCDRPQPLVPSQGVVIGLGRPAASSACQCSEGVGLSTLSKHSNTLHLTQTAISWTLVDLLVTSMGNLPDSGGPKQKSYKVLPNATDRAAGFLSLKLQQWSYMMPPNGQTDGGF